MRRCAAPLAALALAGCISSSNPPPDELKPIGPPPENAPATTPAPAPAQRKPTSMLDAYKQANARRILERNAKDTFEGAPPHFLRSVVVVQLVVDGKGNVTQSRVMRGNGYKDLERRALDSVRRAAPFDPPPHQLLSRNAVEITETFLFRDDGKFQVRSVALPQPTVSLADEPQKRAGRD
jgi:protein TonB